LRATLPARTAGNLPSFIEELAVEELADRLALINRQFRRVGLVSFASGKLEALIRPALATGATVTAIPVITGSQLTLEEPRLEPESFDCLIVSASLEWVNDLPGTLSLLRQAMQPDGVLLASMLGGDTLGELRQAWLEAEAG
jgi:NADH dehydrogenase [ubiquinone] 1 alpha subcomplex assembly factor 5